jgi:uncharacterized protein YoxC
MEVIVGVIALAFVVLVVFLILTLQSTRQTMKKADRVLTDLHKTLTAVSDEGVALIHNANKLTLDIKKKSEALDCLFKPFYAVKKERGEEKSGVEKISEIIQCVAEGIRLFSKIKSEMK